MIKAIDKATVHRICSGQVVVDLANAVKEMVENSLDSGATVIEVKLRNMGIDSIEVSDNGCGIHPDNYDGIATKHCTSKLKDFDDVFTVGTFGFRGEALNSLCELSGAFSVTTKQVDKPVGASLQFDHFGRVSSQKVVARSVGTSVLVEKLFDKLPVRRSELERSAKKQYVKMLKVIQSYALISVGVKIVITNLTVDANGVSSGKQTVLATQLGTRSLLDTTSIVFGAAFAASLVPVAFSIQVDAATAQSNLIARTPLSGMISSGDSGVKMKPEASTSVLNEVTVSSSSSSSSSSESTSDDSLPLCTTGTPSTPNDGRPTVTISLSGVVSKAGVGTGRSDNERQFVFLNGRPVDNQKVNRTMNEVWRKYEMKQKPGFILDLRVPPGLYDVNVTPDKREVLLVHEGLILDRLRGAIDDLYAPSRSTFRLNTPDKRIDVVSFASPQIKMTVEPLNNDVSTVLSSSTQGRVTNASTPSSLQKVADVVNNSSNSKLLTRAPVDSSTKSGSSVFFSSNVDLTWTPPLAVSRQQTSAASGGGGVTRNGVSENSAAVRFNGRGASPTVRTEYGNVSNNNSSSSSSFQSTAVCDVTASKMHSGAMDRDTTNDTNRQPMVVEEEEEEEDVVLCSPSLTFYGSASRGVGYDFSSSSSSKKRPLDDTPSVTSPITAGGGDSNDHTEHSKRPSSTSSSSHHKSPSQSRNTWDREGRSGGIAAQEAYFDRHVHNTSSSSSSSTSSASVQKVAVIDLTREESQSSLTDIPSSQSEDMTLSTEQEGETGTEQSTEGEEKKFVLGMDASLHRGCFDFDVDTVLAKIKANPSSGMFSSAKQTRSNLVSEYRANFARKMSEQKAEEVLSGSATSIGEENSTSRTLGKNDFTRMRVVGQFNLGFIVVELDGDLFVLDQHACDEKYKFETLQRTTRIHQQPLLVPLPLETSVAMEAVIRDNLEIFEVNGFRLQVDDSPDEDVVESDEGASRDPQPAPRSSSSSSGAFITSTSSEGKPRNHGRVKILSVPFSKSVQFGTDDVNELASMIGNSSLNMDSWGSGNSNGDSTDRRGRGGQSDHKNYLLLKNDRIESQLFNMGRSSSENDSSTETATEREERLQTLAARFRLPKLVSMFASRACRSAVMVGTALNNQEMRGIVDRMEGLEQPWNCPHGRPTMRHLLDLKQMDK